MGIGTSLGAFYRDEGHYSASKWDDRYDDNVVKPEQMETNKQMDASEVSPSGPGMEISMKVPGNIDLHNRPMVWNGKSISTVLSKSFNFDGQETLLPTVSDDGNLMSDDEAIKQYKDTGKHLGIFDTPESANTYAKALHLDQEKEYLNGPPVKIEGMPAEMTSPPKGFFDRLSLMNAAKGMANPSFDEDLNMLKGLYETAKRGLTLPGEVASGKVDPSSTEAIDRAADLAMMAVGGSAGTVTKGTLGSGAVFKPPLELGEAGLSKLSNKEFVQYLKDYNSYNKQKASLSEVMAPHEVDDIIAQYKQSIVKQTTEQKKKYDSYIDMYMDQHANKVEDLLKGDKLSFKEAFLRAAEDTHAAFTATAANIQAAFKAAVKEPENLITAGKKDYTQPAYRGLKLRDNELPSPVHSKAGERELMYSSDSPLLADMYSSYLSSHPGVKVPPGAFSEGASVMPLYINTKNYHYYDAKGGSWEYNNGKAIGEAMDQGKHGVIVDNVWDEPNSTKVLGSPKKVFITFPEGAHTVKSRFAKKFDPTSDNMLHGIGAIGVGGAAGYISIADEAHAANLTNTPDEIMSGLEGTRIFGGGTAGPSQVRRAANSNKVGQTDKEIGELVKSIVPPSKKMEDVDMGRFRQINKELSSGPLAKHYSEWSEFDKKRYEKLLQEREDLWKP